MLVYKKVTPEKRTNSTKKNKLKKLDGETNSNNDATSTEKILIKEKSDSLNADNQKCDKMLVVSDMNNSEKISRFDVKVEQEVETLRASPKNIMEHSEKTDLTFDEQNGKHYEFDNKENKLNVILKKPIVKIVKLDYKRLNGAAHRAMSCGERDFYEEVDMFNIFFYYFSYMDIHMDTYVRLLSYRWNSKTGKSVQQCAT